MTPEYYADVEDPAALVPDERDPVTGSRIPSGNSKRHSDHVLRAATKRSVPILAVVAAVVLLAGAATAIVATRGSHRGSADRAAGTEGAGSGRTTVPTGSVTTPVAPRFAFVTYEGGKVIELVNAQLGSQSLSMSCSTKGCVLSLPGASNTPQPPTGHWTAHEHFDAGEICISNGVAAGHEVNDQDWDVVGHGVKTVQGVKVPARLTGTFTSITPGVPNCLTESRIRYQYDAVPT